MPSAPNTGSSDAASGRGGPSSSPRPALTRDARAVTSARTSERKAGQAPEHDAAQRVAPGTHPRPSRQAAVDVRLSRDGACPRSSRRHPLGTTNGNAPWPDPLRPVHRHDVGVCELTTGGRSHPSLLQRGSGRTRRCSTPSAPRRALRHSGPSLRDRSQQAIAKAEAVRGNAARLVITPTLCLCKRRDRRGLAARMLLVHCERLRRWRGDTRSSRDADVRPRPRPSIGSRQRTQWRRGGTCR